LSFRICGNLKPSFFDDADVITIAPYTIVVIAALTSIYSYAVQYFDPIHKYKYNHHKPLQQLQPITMMSLARVTRSLVRSSHRYYTVPIVLEQGALGERSFDIYSRLLRERIICVHGEVTDVMSSLVTAQLLFLEAEAPEKPIYMYINSPGGLVTAGMAMYDTMQYVSPEVHTICMGQAASMGSLLLAGGAPGCRFAL
jgi:hypothetical protein